MHKKVKMEVSTNDITKMKVDAIVNAANEAMLGGGGVDGAIHRVAGPELLEECKKIGPCKTGNSTITKGYRLPTKYIIHTVGPIWKNGKYNEDSLLESCYKTILEIANDIQAKSIAIPCISTGAYSFPNDIAASIAVNTVESFDNKTLEIIYFCCVDKINRNIYKSLLR